MPSPPLIDFRFWIQIVDSLNSVAGLFFNSVLLYLIIKKTKQRMHEYRPILIQNCVVDILYTVVGFFVKAQIDFKDGYFYMMCTGFFAHSSKPWNNILIHFWVFALFYCLTSLPVQFIYRYFLIVQERKLSILQYFGILAFPTLLALIYTVTNIFIFAYNPETREAMEKQLAEDSFYYAGVPNFVVADIRSIQLQIQFGYSYSLVALSYTIIFYANIKIYKKLLIMKSKMSAHTFKLQKQMTFTLLAQAIVPSIICIIPIGIALTMAVIRANVPGMGQILSLIYSCIPVANPLTTIFVISHYRKVCIIFIKTYLMPKKIATVSHVPSDLSLSHLHQQQQQNHHPRRPKSTTLPPIRHQRS